MTGFGDSYNAVFAAAATIFGGVTGIKKAVDSMLALGPDFPQVLITPEPSPSEPGAVASVLDVTVNFSVAVLVTVVEPKNWRKEIVPVMGLVSDAVLANASLNGSVRNCHQTLFAPGELAFKNRVFYGGVIKFSARLRYQK